ncbi:MAG TPA: aminotransferase class III-fold pyridoxal phosphate-dependent enzyme [Kofleriaceae bacterium]|jgi:glutamate-1-semialdehyde aminotransferase|nr:aminotransferase class III-fold pyridoxal phosphate-dependent enzyme [Kofleriaceae bacterium]
MTDDDRGAMARLLDRAARVIPGGVLGFHKLMSPELFPAFAAHARGATVEDLEGRRYVDYILGKGPVILGHGHPAVHEAVVRQLEAGNMLGLSVATQVEVAEVLLTWFPRAEQVRFHKTGSDACSAAVRLARVATGKQWILSSGYHGWHDWCSSGERGVPADSTYAEDFHYDLDRLEQLLARHAGDAAAVFVEPQPSYLEPAFYRELWAIARAHGCLVICDEVKTGLRVVGGSMQRQLGLDADLTVLSKALANGFCLSCVLGRAEHMELSERTHISTTYDVEAIPYAAAAATLGELARPGTLERLDDAGQRLIAALDGLFAALDIPARAFGPGAMFRLGFAEPAREQWFYSRMAHEGVLLYPHDNHFLSTAHGGAAFELTVAAAERVLAASRAEHPPALRHADVAGRTIAQFPSRKGFLQHVRSPRGR